MNWLLALPLVMLLEYIHFTKTLERKCYPIAMPFVVVAIVLLALMTPYVAAYNWFTTWREQ